MDSGGFSDTLDNAIEDGIEPGDREYPPMVAELVELANAGTFASSADESWKLLKSAANLYRDDYPDLLADLGYVRAGGMTRQQQARGKGGLDRENWQPSAAATGDGSQTSLNPENVKATAADTLTAKIGPWWPVLLLVPAILVGAFFYINWKNWRKSMGVVVLVVVMVAIGGGYGAYRALISFYDVAEE